MTIQLTKHAQSRMGSRAIKKEYIQAVLAKQFWRDCEKYRATVDIKIGNSLKKLTVIFRVECKRAVIITLFWN